MSAAARQPVDDRDHLIVNAKRIGESEQGVAWRCDPHDETACCVIRVLEEQSGEKTLDLLYVQVVSVAQRAIHIKTECFYTI